MTHQTDNQQPSLESERKCRNCGEVKPLVQFSLTYSMKSRGKQYRSHTCLDCHRHRCMIKERKRRAANPDRYKEVGRRHYHRNSVKKSLQKRNSYNRLKNEVFAAYGGYRCICCGETERSMLTIDHKNNDGREHRKELKMRWSVTMYGWIRTKGFPNTFQVLCYNCNISKFRNGGLCTHQIKEGSTTIP